ncbi:MAG: HmuY family protein [Flavobacteriales bacterium]
MRTIWTIGPCCAVLLSACLKDELPVPVQPRGEGRSIQVCMGAGYQDQLWMDLRSGTVVSTNPKTAWDLAFESAADGWHVMLNGSRLMTAWNLGAVDITLPGDTNGMGAARRIDAPSGDPDSTAFGDWRGTNNVYLVDLGYDGLGQALGLRKVRMTGVTSSVFTFDVAQLNGSGLQSVTVSKDAMRTFTSYSFANGVVPIEPPAGTWDVVLTQYTHQFYVPYLPYIVTGVLVDRGHARIARIVNADFANVTLSDTLANPFSLRRDAIGYDWKTYSFETTAYTVDASIVYIVENAEGYFNKMRFLDYYGDQGEVGCPLFEVAPL